jgi:hypothetical protein
MTQPDFFVTPPVSEKPAAASDKRLWLAAIMILGLVFMPALIAWSFGLIH